VKIHELNTEFMAKHDAWECYSDYPNEKAKIDEIINQFQTCCDILFIDI